PEAADGSETQGVVELKALTAAVRRAVLQIAMYTPIEGTILSSPGNGPLVLNKGSGSGIKKNQEFNIYRRGVLVGKAIAKGISPGYTDLLVTTNITGIQAQDKAVALFPEPKVKQ
ncbi:MAG: hypothetical protein ABJA67_18775, partial [Chthonomonadales bacterium]